VLIVPSHYDDDGYVIQWLRSAIPSNSLASVYGLLAECADDRVLGPDVDIEVEPHDEMNTVINVDRIVRGIRAAGGGFVGLVDMPDLDAATVPILPRQTVTRVLGKYASFDAGRGCPFQCSFCTIINVQGRKSRYRTADDVETIVRAQARQGITRFFITDDNFARNRNWEVIFDRLIELKEKQGFKFRLLLQVDTLCHRIPNLLEKCGRV